MTDSTRSSMFFALVYAALSGGTVGILIGAAA